MTFKKYLTTHYIDHKQKCFSCLVCNKQFYGIALTISWVDLSWWVKLVAEKKLKPKPLVVDDHVKINSKMKSDNASETHSKLEVEKFRKFLNTQPKWTNAYGLTIMQLSKTNQALVVIAYQIGYSNDELFLPVLNVYSFCCV